MIFVFESIEIQSKKKGIRVEMQQIEHNIGKMGKSLAGHDKNKIYVVIEEDEEYLYLVDGCLKLLEKPKKKKKKHVQLIKDKKTDLLEKKENGILKDTDIKRAIKEYKTKVTHQEDF